MSEIKKKTKTKKTKNKKQTTVLISQISVQCRKNFV